MRHLRGSSTLFLKIFYRGYIPQCRMAVFEIIIPHFFIDNVSKGFHIFLWINKRRICSFRSSALDMRKDLSSSPPTGQLKTGSASLLLMRWPRPLSWNVFSIKRISLMWMGTVTGSKILLRRSMV